MSPRPSSDMWLQHLRQFQVSSQWLYKYVYIQHMRVHTFGIMQSGLCVLFLCNVSTESPMAFSGALRLPVEYSSIRNIRNSTAGQCDTYTQHYTCRCCTCAQHSATECRIFHAHTSRLSPATCRNVTESYVLHENCRCDDVCEGQQIALGIFRANNHLNFRSQETHSTLEEDVRKCAVNGILIRWERIPNATRCRFIFLRFSFCSRLWK